MIEKLGDKPGHTQYTKSSPEEVLGVSDMFLMGQERALEGKNIMSDMIHTNFEGRKNSEEIREYQYGYMSSVIAILRSEGITSPEDLGLVTSFTHVVVDSNAGVLGFRDGRRGKVPSESAVVIDGEEGRIHFEDGYKIGFAFTRALARRGNFTPLYDNTEMTEENKRILTGDVAEWLKRKEIDRYDPRIIIDMNPDVRDGFALYLNNERMGDAEQTLREHVQKRLHQMRTTNARSKKRPKESEIEEKKSLIERGFRAAQVRVNVRDRTYQKNI